MLGVAYSQQPVRIVVKRQFSLRQKSPDQLAPYTAKGRRPARPGGDSATLLRSALHDGPGRLWQIATFAMAYESLRCAQNDHPGHPPRKCESPLVKAADRTPAKNCRNGHSACSISRQGHRQLARGRFCRCRNGHLAGSIGRGFLTRLPHFRNDGGSRTIVDEGEHPHIAAPGLDQFAANHLIEGVIATLDEHVRAQFPQ